MKPSHDLIVIGGGLAGVNAALAAAAQKQRVILIDEHGCISPKRLEEGMVRVFAQTIRRQSDYNQAVQAANQFRTRQLKLQPVKHELQASGVAVISAKAQFSGPSSVSAAYDSYSARQIIVATGTTAVMPEFTTPTTFLSITQFFKQPQPPERLVILGINPALRQLAAARARLGTNIRVIAQSPETTPASNSFALIIASVSSIERLQRSWRINYQSNNQIASFSADVMMAAGHLQPNTQLNLGAAKVEFSQTGIKVNRHGRTSNSHIYAFGGCATIK